MKINGQKLLAMLLSLLLLSDLPLICSSRNGRQLLRKVKQATKKQTRITKSQATKQLAPEPVRPVKLAPPALVQAKEVVVAPVVVERLSKENKPAAAAVVQPISEKEFNQEMEELESTEPVKAEESFVDNAVKTASQWAIWAFDATTSFAQQAWTWTTDVGLVKLKEFKNWLFNPTSCAESCSCHGHN